MRKYQISVREFIEESSKGNINFLEFANCVKQEAERLNKKFRFLRETCDIKDRLYLRPPLNGLPISVKDCICVKDVQSCAGSKILEGYMPTFDATAVHRLKDQGTTILGKTNQDEFGFGTFSTNSGFQVQKNPLDPKRSCGGSSGGAAGLVAALEYPHVALGQSTGGSISAPAAFCGVIGITPTYGLVSRYGLIDYANSLDKIGVMAKTLNETARFLTVIAGHDIKDTTSAEVEIPDYEKSIGKEIKGKKIAVPKEYLKNL